MSILTKEEQNQRARDHFMAEPAERRQGREEQLRRFAQVFKHFEQLGITGPRDGRQRRAAAASEGLDANDFRLNLNQVLPAKRVMEVVREWSANEFDRWLASQDSTIRTALKKDGQPHDDETMRKYFASNPPDLTEPSLTNVTVQYVDKSFASPQQPERVKATREVGLRWGHLTDATKAEIKSVIAGTGVDPEKALEAWRPIHGRRPADDIYVPVNLTMIAEERSQFQEVTPDVKGHDVAYGGWGNVIARDPSDDELLQYAQTKGPSGDLPKVTNREFLALYRESVAADAPEPYAHTVLTAPEGQYSARQKSLVERELAVGVKAKQAGLEFGSREKFSIVAINEVASRALGVDSIASKYRSREGGEARAATGQVAIDADGNAMARTKGSLNIDVGNLPDGLSAGKGVVIEARTRRPVRDADGNATHAEAKPQTAAERKQLSGWQSNIAGVKSRRANWRRGRGWQAGRQRGQGIAD